MKKHSILFVICFAFFVSQARQILIPFELLLLNQPHYNKVGSKSWVIDCIIYGQKSHKNKNGKNLTALFFGKSHFTPQQAHYNQQANSQFIFADQRLAPRLSFDQKGFITTISYQHDYCDQWAFGFEIAIPWKEICIKKENYCKSNGSSEFGGQTIDDVFVADSSDGVSDFAINMEFALKLPTQAQGLGLQVPLVNLENQAYGNQPTMGAVLITDNLFNQIDQNPVTVLESATKPIPPFFIDIGLGANPLPGTARGLPSLDAIGTVNGLPLQQGDRARFVSSIDYGPLGLQKDLLTILWLVPSTIPVPTPALTNRAAIIGRQLKELLNQFSKTPEQEFEQAGLLFDAIKQRGLGDVGLKLYALYRCTKKSTVQFSSGFLVPCAGSLNEHKSSHLFAVSRGSNGHVQPFLQADFVHTVNEWFCYGVGLWLAYALPASEYIPASFFGAAVKNLGPITRADISWMSTIFQTNFSFFVPVESEYAPYLSASYQWYYKSNDRVSFLYHNGYDWAGNFYPLSSAVAQKNSNRVGHVFLIQGGIKLKSHGLFECGWQGVVGGFNTVLSNGWTVRLGFVF